MDIAPNWEVLFKEENQKVTLRNIRVLCLIAMVLVPLAVVLDYLKYPDLWPVIFFVRATVSVVEILLLVLSYTKWGVKHYRLLMLLVPLVPAVAIAWMIFISGDPASPYYAGLTLVLVGVGFLYQWSHVESIIAVAITIGLYLAATIPLVFNEQVSKDTTADVINNCVFILLNSVVIITGSLVHFRIRKNEVISRYRLSESQWQLEEKNQQLVEMDRLKMDFFSNVTHELRTPLTLMLAPMQRLLRLSGTDPAGIGTSRTGRQSELGGIYQNGLRLLKLINDLLDISSVDAGRLKIKFHEFRIDELAGRLATSIKSIAEQSGLNLAQQVQINLRTVRADEEKLEKILLNLLFNAVKFTPSGGTVSLKISQDNSCMVFEVQDTGTGIDAKSLPYIFDRFWQADTSVTRQHPGTGLGLSLVKEFAVAMGGRVEARSTLGKGTCMRVILPCSVEDNLIIIGSPQSADEPEGPAPAVDLAQQPSEKSPESSAWIQSIYREAETAYGEAQEMPFPQTDSVVLRQIIDPRSDSKIPLVLIADDEPGMLRFMRSELESRYRIIKVTDGKAALEVALQHRPDLIIADYMMPAMDGLTLCRELRKSKDFRATPIMLVSARTEESVRLNALQLGANDVLVKPFSLSEFNSRVDNLVENHLLHTQIEERNARLEKTLDELRAAERELIQSEKMAALGILTGGIMHEINNPLNFTRSALYVLDRRLGRMENADAGEISGIVEDVREGINRITTIVSELRTFCHPDVVMASSCSISEALQSATRLIAAPMREAAILLEENVPDFLLVRGDKNQLTLVFINLLKNALDALSSSTSGNKPRQIHVNAKPLGANQVEISFTDNGPGISPDYINRVFDPFFTTKAPGEGTGLGLSICYRIITAHGGMITASSKPGRGTKFTIQLARAETPARAVEALLPALSA